MEHILLLLLNYALIPVSILVLFSCFFYLAPFSIFTDKDGFPRNWPLLGMLPALVVHYNDILDWTVHLVNRTGFTNFLVKGPCFSNLDLLLTLDPADVQYTSSTRFSNFPRGPKSKEFFDVFGDGYFNRDSTEWSAHRKIHRAFLSHKRLNQCFTDIVFQKVEKGLVSILDEVAKGNPQARIFNTNNVVDLQELFQRYTYDLTSKLITGYDPHSLSLKWPEVPFLQAMGTAMQAVFMRHFLPEKIWKLQGLIGVGKEVALKKAKQVLNGITHERVSTKHKEFTSLNFRNDEVYDMLTTYMSTDEHYRSGAGDKVLKDSVCSLLLAGESTTSSAMAWFFWLLSQHPRVESKIVEELRQVLLEEERDNWHLFNQEEVSKLVYLHAAVCEALRLYPPVPFQTRAPRETDTLPTGHKVKQNSTLIVIPLYIMARARSVWGEDCAEFKPERWIMEDGAGIKHEPSHKFFTFNCGPRICLGKELAFTEIKAAVATVLHNYKVEILGGQKVEPVNSVVLQMRHALNARITKLKWP